MSEKTDATKPKYKSLEDIPGAKEQPDYYSEAEKIPGLLVYLTKEEEEEYIKYYENLNPDDDIKSEEELKNRNN